MTKKTALVLEGGGMRGAYTAGCMSWLIDNNISFDNHYGISTGAIHLCSYLLQSKKFLFEISTKYIADKSAIGISSILREGRIVSYDYLFNELLAKKVKYDFDGIAKSQRVGKIGLYDLSIGKTVYFDTDKINVNHLKAAASLPLIGKVVKIGDTGYLDGGITEMIAIEKSLSDGNQHNLIITTKPAGYVRKPSNKFVCKLMEWVYPNCPNIAKDYAVRHLNYYKQLEIIKEEEKNNCAVYIYPSEEVKVSRLSGDPEKLEYLYNLGRKDMETNKEKIYALFK